MQVAVRTERCAGSDVAVGYADGYGHEPIVVANNWVCEACGQTIGVYRDPINVRIVEHSR